MNECLRLSELFNSCKLTLNLKSPVKIFIALNFYVSSLSKLQHSFHSDLLKKQKNYMDASSIQCWQENLL